MEAGKDNWYWWSVEDSIVQIKERWSNKRRTSANEDAIVVAEAVEHLRSYCKMLEAELKALKEST